MLFTHNLVVFKSKKIAAKMQATMFLCFFLVAVCEGHGQVMQLLHCVIKLVDHKKSDHAVLVAIEEGHLVLLIAAIGADLYANVVIMHICYCYRV